MELVTQQRENYPQTHRYVTSSDMRDQIDLHTTYKDRPRSCVANKALSD